MRKIILVGCMLAVAACAKVPNSSNDIREVGKNDKLRMISNESFGQSIYEDVETGCQYFTSYQGVTFPRLNPDGKTIKGCKDGN